MDSDTTVLFYVCEILMNRFRDCMLVLKDPQLTDDLCKELAATMKRNHPDTKITAVAGLEARGFLFAPLIAQHLQCACLPIRKKGKLPGEKWRQEYTLEYGSDAIEIQKEAVGPDDNIVIFDDLLATGGTLKNRPNVPILRGSG